MNIVWIGSPHVGYPNGVHGRSGNRIVGIIDHIMGGSLAGCDAWFRNPDSGVSAHYGVGKQGEVHQYILDGDAAYGAGSINRPDTSLPWLPPLGPSVGRLVNQRVLSIEHEGQSGEPLTDAQFAATVELHRYLVEKHGIPVDDQHIIAHARLDSVNRAGCPGSGFPWAALFAALQPQEEAMTQRERDAITAALVTIWDRLDRVQAVARGETTEDIVSLAEEAKQWGVVPVKTLLRIP